MSTELGVVNQDLPDQISVTRFCGSVDRGMCVQLTTPQGRWMDLELSTAAKTLRKVADLIDEQKDV
jgi:hypothetical protein